MGSTQGQKVSEASIQFYDFNLSAGGSQYLPASGAYYRVISSTGPVTIREDVGSKCGPISAGQGMKERNFGFLTISDSSGAANVGTIAVASSEFIDQTLYGNVSIIDSAFNQAIAGSAYATGYASSVAASNYGILVLQNTSANKNVALQDIEINGVNGAQSGAFGLFAAGALPNYVGLGYVQTTTGIAKNKNPSKGNSAIFSITGMYSGASTSFAGNSVTKTWAVQAGATYRAGFKSPIILPPQSAMVITSNTASLNLNVNVEHLEF